MYSGYSKQKGKNLLVYCYLEWTRKKKTDSVLHKSKQENKQIQVFCTIIIIEHINNMVYFQTQIAYIPTNM